MKLLLIDAYAFIYRSYYAFIKNPRINSRGVNTSAIFGFVNTLEDVMRRINPTHVAIGFDPPGPTFRHEVFEKYKAQREETPEVIRESVPVIRDIIEAYNIPILEVPRYEADDVIGTISKQAEKEGFDVYMTTPDKDYGQLVSEHIFQYRPKFGGDYETLGTSEVLEKYGLTSVCQMIDLLGLMGDVSDNIPGCPGIGEKTAQKLLIEFGSVENLFANTGQLKGSLKDKIERNVENIRFSKFLATIVTDIPIKFDAALCIREKPDENRLVEIYRELEFNSFLTRMDMSSRRQPDKKKLAGQKQGAQLSLFDESVFDNETSPDNEVTFSENSILKDITSVSHSYYLVDNGEKISDLVRVLGSRKRIAFDTETDGRDPVTAKLVGMSFAIKELEAWYVPVPEAMNDAMKIVSQFAMVLENREIEKVGQNIKFDILVLRKYGVCLNGPLFDTMIAHYLINPELRHGMDYLSETYLNYKPVSIESLIGPKGKGQLTMRDVPVEKVTEYAAEDADVTLRLMNFFEPKLRENALESLFYDIEMPLVYVLAEMEFTGVKLDTEALSRYSVLLTEKLQILEREIYELAGMEFNINSAKQVGDVLFDNMKITDEKIKRTKTGGFSTSEETLEKLRHKHQIVGTLLDYRGIKKLLGTYIDALPKLINPETGKIHTSFNQTVTSTGRLSSTNPNLQNIPVRDDMGREIRKAFIADNDDCVFFSADYSQIELRVMAHISMDKNMIDAFVHGADIHSATAAKIYGISDEDVTFDMRRKAKTANFGIIYGISVFGLAERLAITRTEAKELITGYFKTYPRIQEFMDESIRFAREKGYVETLYNRRRYLPDICSNNAIVRGYAERNAINAPIQGSAADIIKVAMVNIYKRFESENLKSKMILQVHDELNFNVYKDELEKVRKIVLEEMEGAISLQVPLIADCGEGRNWFEAH
ncbi:MAG: DNA polymerase I [Dysgonamonadaceae bacterium]|jgi:DNA polymerase-1|nr:DNA polymerase I [Dysgonamonadaceae bacterium]